MPKAALPQESSNVQTAEMDMAGDERSVHLADVMSSVFIGVSATQLQFELSHTNHISSFLVATLDVSSHGHRQRRAYSSATEGKG